MKQKRPRRRLNPDTVLLIRHIIIGVMVVSFVSLLILSVWYGTRVEAFTLRTVSVSGGETIAHADIVERVNQTLTGTYLGVVPKRFSFLYPKKDIAAVLDGIERIKDFSISRPDAKTITINFSEYVPDALWCDGTDTKCIFLDETGFAFTAAPQLQGGAFMRLEKVGTDPVIGIQAFSGDEYRAAHDLVEVLEGVGWYVRRVEIDAASDAYLEIVSGGEFKVSLLDEPVAVVDNLLTVLTAPEFSHIEAGNFEYIDLRFGNKVFVKELAPEPEPEPEPAPISVPADVETPFVPPVLTSEDEYESEPVQNAAAAEADGEQLAF